MSLQVENLEKNMAKLTVEVPAEQFDAAIKSAYNKNKGRFAIPGFRKGKAPLAMIEKMYGLEVFLRMLPILYWTLLMKMLLMRVDWILYPDQRFPWYRLKKESHLFILQPWL